jgi:hypothetical protein
MARLPGYQNQQSIGSSDLDTGAAFMRPERGNTDTARSLARLGNAVSDFADDRFKADATVSAKAARTAETDSNLMLESRLLDYQTQLQTEMQKRADEMPEGGFGFAKGLQEFAATEADKAITKDFADRPDQDFVALKYQKVRQAFVNNALETEYKTRLDWRGDVAGKKVADLQGAIGADPANYEFAASAWEEFVSTSIDGGSNAKERFRVLGLAKLARSELEARAAADPVAFRSSFRGAFENQPTKMAEPHVAGIIDAANDSGLNPRFMLGVAKIESNVNPKAGNPMRRDGTAMSSAAGMWQILAAPDTLGDLGISKEDRMNYDVATPAIGRYFAKQKAAIEARGGQATPGKLYMTWNIGPGATAAVMSADPSTPIETVLSRVWASKGPNFINTALSNNPSMYKRGMTVGQVLANYERKMDGAMKSSEGYITGVNIASDAQARDVFTSMGLKGGQYIGARDAAEVFVKTNAEIGKTSAADAKLIRGVGILNKEIVSDPYDNDNQSAVNEVVAANNLSQGIASGDANAVVAAKFRVSAAGFIPLPDVNAFRAAMNEGGPNPGKLMAYATLTDISTNDPVAYDASKIPEDERSRVKEYRAYTEVSGMSPADAVKRIDEARTPEGKARREAMAKQFEGKKGEIEKLTFHDIQSSPKFDKSSFSTPEAVSGAQQDLAVDAYRASYRYWRENGKDVDEAKSIAISELDRSWGTSTVNGNQRFMQYPPEKYYKPVGGTYDWMHEQAKNTVKSDLIERGIIKNRTFYKAFSMAPVNEANEEMDKLEVFFRPTPETASDIRSGKPPRYELWFRKPNGTTDVIGSRFFTPKQTIAEQEFKAKEEAEAEKKLKNRQRDAADNNALDGIAYAP